MTDKNRKNLYVITNGCLRRVLDTTRLIEYFKLNDCSVVEKAEDADYVIFVTCAFNKNTEERCFEFISRFPQEKIIVMGCLPATASSRFRNSFKGKYLITKKLDEIDLLFKDFEFKFHDVPDSNFISPRNIISLSPIDEKPSFAYLRLSRGCLGNCTYCAIRNATGKLVSKPLDICLLEYKELLNKGYRNFVLTGEDTGAYGMDIKSSFSELIDRLSFTDRIFKVKWCIEEFHPHWIIKYSSELLKKIKKRKITALSCTIESGSDKILKLMNRPTSVKDAAKILLKFRKANSGIELYTHIIVGFPSETGDDFNATLALLKRVRFNMVLMLAYSDMEGTVSSAMPNKVEHKIIKERLKSAALILDKEGIKYGGDILKTDNGPVISNKLLSNNCPS